MTIRGHIQELDGVRGIAILLVLAAHFTPDVAMPSRALEWLKKALEGGWIGVDLFFVLSGFLITGILLRTKGKPNALKIFYARRILRIFPLYCAALIAVFLVVPFAMRVRGIPFAPEFQTLLRFQAWVWLHATNIGMYVAPAHSFQSPVVSISHFWSLSVEEQFYLAWPFVVFGLPLRRLKALCLAIMCLALAVRTLGLSFDQNPYFFVLTPCRMDALAVGSYLAAASQNRPISNLYGKALLVGSISCAALAVYFIEAHGLWPRLPWMQGPGLTLLGLLFGSLLVIVLSPDAAFAPRRICRSSALRFFGQYSYGIYVIHGLLGDQLNRMLPFASFAARTGSTVFAMLAVILFKSAICVAVALVSWFVLEQPALWLKRYFEIEPEFDARPVADSARAASQA